MENRLVYEPDAPIVQTAEGKLRGFCLDGVYTFQGIKYANAKRFQMPTPVEPWEGVKDACNYGYVCPIAAEPMPSGELYIPHRFWPQNENCQYLNVWTTELDKTAKKPVMVWLHGGGYANGSSIEQVAYEGNVLSEYGDVVVVSLNHRLNILGFLDMSSFGEKYKNSVNAGMADIVEALRWIHRNIEAFGGDPDNVTVFGQSGGGGKCETLLQIPEAAGLFHKAIIMSGILQMAPTPDVDVAANHRRLVEGMLEVLNIPVEQVERLEKVPYDVLNRAFNKVHLKLIDEGISIGWGPVANDWYLGDPMVVGFSDYAKKVPTMSGTVIAEFAAFGPLPNPATTSEKEMKKLLKEKYGKYAEKLIEQFKAAYPDKDLTRLLAYDTVARLATTKFTEEKSKVSSAPDYLYLFALDFPLNGTKPAWHCSDIPFVFHNTHRVPCCDIEDVTDVLEDQMAGAWVNFARHGNPNHEGMRKWAPYGEKTPVTMVFDRDTRPEGRFDRDLVETLAEAVPAMNFFAGMAARAKKAAESDEGGEWIY